MVQAALQSLATQGHAQFSLSELARTLGVTPAAVYKHFADKEAVVAELARLGFVGLAQAFEQAAPQAVVVTGPKQAVARLRALATAYHAFACEQPALFDLMFGVQALRYRRAARQAAATSGTYERLVDALLDLHRSGACRIKPTAQHSWLAWCMVHGASSLSIHGAADDRASPAVGEAVAKALVAMLQVQPGQ